jgi:hypothetical protein
MAPIFHPKGNRGFVYDVIVTTNETVRLSLRYRAHSSNREPVGMDASYPSRSMADRNGPTVGEGVACAFVNRVNPASTSVSRWLLDQARKRC